MKFTTFIIWALNRFLRIYDVIHVCLCLRRSFNIFCLPFGHTHIQCTVEHMCCFDRFLFVSISKQSFRKSKSINCFFFIWLTRDCCVHMIESASINKYRINILVWLYNTKFDRKVRKKKIKSINTHSHIDVNFVALLKRYNISVTGRNFERKNDTLQKSFHHHRHYFLHVPFSSSS